MAERPIFGRKGILNCRMVRFEFTAGDLMTTLRRINPVLCQEVYDAIQNTIEEIESVHDSKRGEWKFLRNGNLVFKTKEGE